MGRNQDEIINDMVDGLTVLGHAPARVRAWIENNTEIINGILSSKREPQHMFQLTLHVMLFDFAWKGGD